MQSEYTFLKSLLATLHRPGLFTKTRLDMMITDRLAELDQEEAEMGAALEADAVSRV